MKNYNEEYFLFARFGLNIPDLEFDGPMSIQNTFKVWKREAIDDSVIPLRIEEPIPRKPKMVDVHNLRGNIVISERLKLLLESLNLKDIQYIPATIRGKNDEIFENYYIPHIYNMVRCADMEKSMFDDWNKEDAVKRVYDFNRLVLDNEVLDKIPLEKRLVVYVEESTSSWIYHHSIVKKMLELKPKLTGGVFYQLSTYDESKPFQAEFLDWIINGEE